MKYEEIDLRSIIEGQNLLEDLQRLIKQAVLYPDLMVRQEAIDDLVRRTNGTIEKGYYYDGNLCFETQPVNDMVHRYIVGECPKSYLGQVIRPIPFNLNEMKQ